MRRIISITLILESAEVQPLIVALYSNERATQWMKTLLNTSALV